MSTPSVLTQRKHLASTHAEGAKRRLFLGGVSGPKHPKPGLCVLFSLAPLAVVADHGRGLIDRNVTPGSPGVKGDNFALKDSHSKCAGLPTEDIQKQLVVVDLKRSGFHVLLRSRKANR